jgi:hypothetical protein
MQNNFTSLNGSIHSLFNQSFSFKHLAVLVTSILVVLCAVWLPYALFWQLDGLLSLQQAQLLGSSMFYGGIASFVAIAVVTRFKLSKDWSLKRNVGVFSVLLLVTLVFSSLLSAPVVAALTPLPSDSGPNGSSAYKFSIPFTPYEWFIGEFRDGSYYAVNGSDWNIMTIVEPWQPVAPWAALSTNLTALTEQVLSVTPNGTVFLKQVAFDLALMNSIGENVAVVENVNGLARTFINPLDKAGSPYTVSVVGADYFGADKENQICYTNTVPNTLLNAVVALGGDIIICNGAYTGTVLTVPATANIKAEASVTGITYTAIANGARIDEPTFNSMFGGYMRGSYSLAVYGANCLAFKPDNTIWSYSTATTAIQYALNNLRSTKGEVFLRSGDYDLNATGVSIVSSGVKLVGESGALTGYGTILKYNGTATALTVGSSGSIRQDIEVENIKIQAYETAISTAAAIGIKIQDTVHLKMSFVGVTEFEAGIGIYIICSASQYNVGASFSDIYVWNCKGGISTDGNAADHAIGNIVFNNPQIYCKGVSGSYGIRIGAYTSGVNIFGGFVENAYTAAYYIASASASAVTLYGTNTQGEDSGASHISCHATASNTTRVINHKFSGVGTLIGGTRPSEIIAPVGYTIQNSDNATGTGSEQTIAHGCSFTPTVNEVVLSERSTGGALAYQTKAPDATNIYVLATNEKDFIWKVDGNT